MSSHLYNPDFIHPLQKVTSDLPQPTCDSHILTCDTENPASIDFHLLHRIFNNLIASRCRSKKS